MTKRGRAEPDTWHHIAVTLNEYALGKNGDVFPAGTGRLAKAGSIIRFNLHCASIGTDTTDPPRQHAE